MKRITDDFRVVVNDRLVDGRVIITWPEKPWCFEPWCNDFIKHIFSVIRMTGPDNAVRIQRIYIGVRIGSRSIPEFIGNSPPDDIPESVVFKRKFYFSFILNPL